MSETDGKHRLPFVSGLPSPITGSGWLLVLAAVVAAFAALTAPFAGSLSGPFAIIPATVFAGLPLFALAYVSRGQWRVLFRRYSLKAFGISILFAVFTVVASFCAGWLLSLVAPMKSNPVNGFLATMSAGDLVFFLIRTFIQLIGEEVVTILPLLAVVWMFANRFAWSFAASLAAGVFISTAWFSAMHLPTYDWNLVQTFGVIGVSRLVLTASYLYTRNLWVSAGAHIMNDWTLFALSFVGSHVSAGID